MDLSRPLLPTCRDQYGSALAASSSVPNTSCQQSRGTANVEVGFMFWPNSSAKFLDLAQRSMCVTASVFPDPGLPLTKTIPPGPVSCDSCLSSTCRSSAQTGHPSQESSFDSVCFSLRTTRESILPVKRNTSTCLDLPFREMAPSGRNSRKLWHASCVAASTRTVPAIAFAMRRAERLTVSPSTVYSLRRALPTTPHQQVPVATPACPARPSSCRVSQSRVAVSTARMGSSVKWFTGGRPKTTSRTMPLSSTMNLLMLPSRAYTER
mmetsp:Transcript_69138/g.202464  ORF Transcript_69138/g.202464 Transcript_69138/m.202464 type:complete len:266 (-) Transcript_69138:1409-2206(-)